MTGSVSCAAWLKRSRAVRRFSPGSRNEADFETRSSDRLCRVGPIRRAHLARIDDAAEPAAVIDDEYLLDAAGRKPSAQLVERQLGGDHRRVAPHHRADQQLVDPTDILGAADRQTAQMKAPSGEGIAEPVPHRDRCGDDPDHDADGRRKIAGRLEHDHDHRHRRPDDRGGDGTHADQRIDQRIDAETGAEPRQHRSR